MKRPDENIVQIGKIAAIVATVVSLLVFAGSMVYFGAQLKFATDQNSAEIMKLEIRNDRKFEALQIASDRKFEAMQRLNTNTLKEISNTRVSFEKELRSNSQQNFQILLRIIEKIGN